MHKTWWQDNVRFCRHEALLETVARALQVLRFVLHILIIDFCYCYLIHNHKN